MEEQSIDDVDPIDLEEQEKNVIKSLASVESRRKKNEIIIGSIALMTFIALGINDKIGVPIIVMLPIELVRLAAIIFFVVMEHRAFEKYLQKKYPLAFQE